MKSKILLFTLFYAIHAAVFAQNNLVSSIDCASSRPPFSFDIKSAWTSASNSAHCYTSPLAGDLDGDGYAEVLVVNTGRSGINIMDGRTGASKGSINIGVLLESQYTTFFLIVDGDNDGKAEVFIAGTSTDKVYLYEVTSAPGAPTITFNKLWEKSVTLWGNGVTPIVADLDGNGTVEFVAGEKVIDYNGNELGTLPFHSTPYDISISYAADVDGDNLPEIINGSDVYKYANGTLTRTARCPSFPSGIDGYNMSGDIDMDGNVDLVLTSAAGQYTVWTPKTNTVMGSFSVTASFSSNPFIGDIDGTVNPATGKKHPEICFIASANNYLYAYAYTGSGFVQKWKMSHSDASGLTGITLFDFNLDGAAELVYRDMTDLRIFDGSGTEPVNNDDPNVPRVLETIPCTSGTGIETPIVADVTGDGSADIIVTGGPNSGAGSVYTFEGATSKWAAAPNVWNQQMYSPLFVNLNLTIPRRIESQTLAFVQTCTATPQTVHYYNGGPMQAPLISDLTYCPFELSPDVYVVSGSLTIAGNSLTFSLTFGNMGRAKAPAGTPIRYYRTAIGTANVIATETLGVDLEPGQTRTIVRTLTLSPMPAQFYVRILDDGTNFPAAGAYSDCNLSNNTKSFGTLELIKTVNSTNVCVDGTGVFTIELVNNSSQTASNIALTDSLGVGWQYLSASTPDGSLGAFDAATRRINWNIPSLAPGGRAQMRLTATAVSFGDIRNYAWINAVDGTPLNRELTEAYVIVQYQAPVAPSLSPAGPVLCEATGLTLTAVASGATSYQWYRNGEAVGGATQSTYFAKPGGLYTVTYSNGVCISQVSAAVTVSTCVLPVNPHLMGRFK
jgi:uncharacterized repeat protein (TIGR01451 family)